ncbi:glycosyltransferase family 87 protein [Microvirga sp. CF3062]|uniref:glycosyltransferase family 87 protein n=1 Tax=Microvirga sp. CF3062 TaxID=3110182 RepID=UPI002E7A35A3|nr:glycosyltransferase family 87 protein [Microvirga sp. CF3062]MEE1655332.1 glycosyltransferase family 87 protein [Microvirga sp. CF3062]
MKAAARWITGLLIVIAALLAIRAELPRILNEPGLWDFGSFVASGRAASEGLNPYGIYPLTLRVELPGFESWNPNLNPPISALLFQAFDVADPYVTYQVWRWISVAVYAAAILLLVSRVKNRAEALVIAVWAFALAGFWDTLFLGQIYLPLVLAGVAAWLLLERGVGLWAGILIGIIVAMKPNFLVWPVLLLLSGQHRSALAAFITAGAISLIPLAIYGPDVYLQWFELVAADGDRALFLTNGSFAGLAARAGIPSIGLVLGFLLLMGLAAWALWRRPDVLTVSAMALLASILASPLGWIHYTLFLLPVIVMHWNRMLMRVVALLLIIPVPFIIDQLGKPAWTQLTVGSVYGWSLVLCLAILIADEWRRIRQHGQRKPDAMPLLERHYRQSAS